MNILENISIKKDVADEEGFWIFVTDSVFLLSTSIIRLHG